MAGTSAEFHREQHGSDLGCWLVSHRREMDQGECAWLEKLAAFDAEGLWARDGQLSCVEWLVWKTGLARSTCYEKQHIAHQLTIRPIVADAFRAGRISYSAARVLCRMEGATTETDEAVVALAEHGTVRQVEQAVTHYQRIADQERPPADPDLRRCLRRRPVGEGWVRLEATLPETEAEEVMMAIEAVAAEIRRSARAEDGKASTPKQEAVSRPPGHEEGAASARADDAGPASATPTREARAGDGGDGIDDNIGLKHRPDSADGAGGGDDDPGDGDAETDEEADGDSNDKEEEEDDESARADDAGESAAQRRWRISRADALVDLAKIGLEHANGGHAVGDDRYMLHLVGREGEVTTIDGTPLTPETATTLLCDTSVVAHTVDDNGEPLQLGRKTKVWSTAQRRAVLVRDGGHCRFPGCERRVVDVHHCQWWTEGGRTDVDNALTVCRRHHRLLHHGFGADAGPDGAVHFRRPDGTRLGTTHPARQQLGFAA